MRRLLLLVAVIVGTLLFVLPDAFGWFLKMDKQIRPALVAGQFYPADQYKLRLMLSGLLNEARPQFREGAPFAIVVPHAGMEFSGHVAAHAFSLIKRHRYKRVVIIAPSHVVAFPFASIYNGDAYETPLGKIPVDKEFARKLAETNPLLDMSDVGHELYQGRAEHAIEIELPFLQEVLSDFKIVPIIMGEQNYTIERALGVALSELIKVDEDTDEPDTLIVASSDLSHYHDYDQAVSMDKNVIDSISNNDYFSLSVNFENRIWEACGGGPIVSSMIAAERLGARDSVILKYANSGDVTRDKSQVVGYVSAAFFHKDWVGQSEKPDDFSISDEDKKSLSHIAKASVERFVRRQKPLEISVNAPEALKAARGVFVTIKKEGDLRGCIGFITPSKPLAEAVRDVSIMSSSKDSRFKSVSADELGELKYEISIMSPFRRITKISEVKVGRDGLLIRKGGAQGVLLPQVPVELGWNELTFVEQVARKAGLPPNAWMDRDTDLFAFSAVVFKDSE